VQNDKLKRVLITFCAAVLIGLILAMPFAILEFRYNVVNTRKIPDYIVLFGFLWILPTTFFFTVAPIVRTLRAGNSVLAHPVTLFFRVAFLVLIAIMWTGIIHDQLPCFLGAPNCD
jgi:hypothetical protein